MGKKVRQHYRSGIVKECIVEDIDENYPHPSTNDTGNDPCPVCDENLYLNVDFTKRIAITKEDTVVGWICPVCWSEFDMDDNVVELYTRLEEKPQS
tara:strand:- start:787 stop:1074 length:288 start_codon:yes stop_codon:yes gene_type:complete